jgi:hypothetical protein
MGLMRKPYETSDMREHGTIIEQNSEKKEDYRRLKPDETSDMRAWYNYRPPLVTLPSSTRGIFIFF